MDDCVKEKLLFLSLIYEVPYTLLFRTILINT